jgi:hypothetical protein
MAATRAVWDRSAYDASSIAGSLSIVNPRLAGAHVGLSTRVAFRQRRPNDEAARGPEATGTMENSAKSCIASITIASRVAWEASARHVFRVSAPRIDDAAVRFAQVLHPAAGTGTKSA